MCVPYVSPGMIGEVVDTLKSRWIGEAHKVKIFESKVEKLLGLEEGTAVAVNSGTSALELAYHLIGLTKNDEVIAPVLTCTATNLPLIRRGCNIRFADIDKHSLCPSSASILKNLTKDTKAVITVNLSGIKADIPKLNCPLVVDACQSFGIVDKRADYTCYSFQAIKHITCGDGGMLICKSKEDAKKAKLLRWFGIDRDKKIANNWQPYKNRKILFDIDMAGYKYHMNDISAGMGIGALREWEDILAFRKTVFNMYKKAVEGIKGIEMIDGKVNQYWLAGLLVEDRDSFCKYLTKKGIETNVMHVRNDVYSVFEKFRGEFPNMDWADERYVYIPFHNRMTIDDARYVIKSIQEWSWSNGNQSPTRGKAPSKNQRADRFTL